MEQQFIPPDLFFSQKGEFIDLSTSKEEERTRHSHIVLYILYKHRAQRESKCVCVCVCVWVGDCILFCFVSVRTFEQQWHVILVRLDPIRIDKRKRRHQRRRRHRRKRTLRIVPFS